MKTRQSQAEKKNRLNASKPSARLSCLITGFDPFNEHRSNPSASVTSLMPEHFVLKGTHVPVTKLVLPTQGKKAWHLLKKTIANLPANNKRVIILLGLAAGVKAINIERFALNILDYQIKDNDGHMFIGKRIYNDAPEALRTKAPIEKALGLLTKQGLPAAISNYSGSFVCNETYFRLLHYTQTLEPSSLVSFIHLPLPRDYGATLKKMANKKYKHAANSKDNHLMAMTHAIKIIAQFYCEYITK